MTQTRDLIKKMADFFTGKEFFEKGDDARLELSPDDVRCMNEIIKACGNGINRQAVLDMIEGFIADATSHGISARLDPYYVMDGIKDLPSVKPQESCDVPDTNVGDIISKQTVLDTISELNAISFYEAQEDSRETYYEIRQAIKDLSPVKQEPKTVLYSGDGYADGYMVYDMAECPNCGYEYETGDKDWGLPFCPSCGQKLNWESEEVNGKL